MRTVIALSGGVDSSVAALKLKELGHELVGVTIKTWPKENSVDMSNSLSCSPDSIELARKTAETLKIPHYVIDLSNEFDKHIIDYFVKEYENGRTPNPCIFCNSIIKFGYLYKKAIEMGFSKIASGHYAKILAKNGQFYLVEPKDKVYDQTYFLADIHEDMLSNIEFPLWNMTKEEVKKIALKNDLVSCGQKSSQDICFASGKGGYREYLSKKGITTFLPGDIIDINGRIIGSHKGIASYTIGQRKGLGISGSEPYYVIKIDPVNNTVMVGFRAEAMNKKIRVNGINWLAKELLNDGKNILTRIRYNGKKTSSYVKTVSENEVIVSFDEEQFAPTPGQAAVFYNDSIVLGGGWIQEIIE